MSAGSDIANSAKALEQADSSIGLQNSLRLLLQYARRHFLEQLNSIWFIVTYLIIFQILVLQLPLTYSLTIAVGIAVVLVGLMFFMEGLRLGLMPLGETIGVVFPRSAGIPLILAFAFVLGIGATFAEPAIAVLKAAGKGVSPEKAPLLYSLLNEFSGQLVMSVGVGVGLAVLLGVLRFFRGWSLKVLILPAVTSLLLLSWYFNSNEVLRSVLGLAWDCGAVTTGPVTVPLVLALGIGVCRVVSSGDSSNAGFGIVTLASLFPIFAVLLLSLYHYQAQDYIGAKNGSALTSIQGASNSGLASSGSVQADQSAAASTSFTTYEFDAIKFTDFHSDEYNIAFSSNTANLEDGSIVLSNPIVTVNKNAIPVTHNPPAWDNEVNFSESIKSASADALRAIIPLCLFLFVVLSLVLRQTLNHPSEVAIGIAFALVGMTLFSLGIGLGLSPLGGQLGANVPSAFAEIKIWQSESLAGPLFSSADLGKLLAVIFAFFLGYGATLAEPALNALGDTVDKITAGAFRKKLLMQSVAVGVGLGIGAGILKIAYNIPLYYLLAPPYLLLLVLTWISSEEFVNFGWDSAGVTTGPITVPLVLAIGLGVGGNVPNVIDGFGVLALASVGPILTVLTVGLITNREERKAANPA